MASERKKIILADDDVFVRGAAELILGLKFPDYEVESFGDGTSLEERLKGSMEDVALVITDNNMPGNFGSLLISRYSRKEGMPPFILNYGGSREIGEKAVQEGAFAYQLKGCYSNKEFCDTISRALNL